MEGCTNQRQRRLDFMNDVRKELLLLLIQGFFLVPVIKIPVEEENDEQNGRKNDG